MRVSPLPYHILARLAKPGRNRLLRYSAGVAEELGHASAPRADDGFGERFPLKGDRLEDRPGTRDVKAETNRFDSELED